MGFKKGFMKFLLAEFAFFRNQKRNVRTLLIAMSIYFLTAPLQNIFSYSYILGQTHSVKHILVFMLALFSAVPVISWVTGRWMSRWGAERLFAFGLALSGVALFTLSLVNPHSLLALSLVGAAMGSAITFIWVPHNYLVFVSTTDETRNYFQSLELSCQAICTTCSSFFIGWFVSRVLTPEISYRIVQGMALLLTLASALIMLQDRFPLPSRAPFVFFHHSPLAKKLFLISFLRGFTQLFATLVPVVLVFCILKQNEFLLGKIQSLGAITAGFLLYLVGRLSSPRHRLWLFIVSALMLAFAACLNALLQTTVSALFLILVILFFGPLLEVAYMTLYLRGADQVAKEEQRTRYTYIFAQESSFYLGRAITLLLCLFAVSYSVEMILTVAIPLLALLHLFSLPLAWSLNKTEFPEVRV
jgi:YQGE family putative transporter